MKKGLVSSHHYLEYHENYKGYQFVVLFNSGGWRLAYVNVKNTYLENIDYMECDKYLSVHGGFTYKENRLPFEQETNENVSWLGWDYAHYGDGYDFNKCIEYFGAVIPLSSITKWNPHVYTLDEVIHDCKEVIDVLVGDV